MAIFKREGEIQWSVVAADVTLPDFSQQQPASYRQNQGGYAIEAANACTWYHKSETCEPDRGCTVYLGRLDSVTPEPFERTAVEEELFRHDPDGNRAILYLVHRDCPAAEECMKHVLEEMDMQVVDPAKYDDFDAFDQDMQKVMQRILDPFDHPDIEAARILRRETNLKAYSYRTETYLP